MSKTALVDSGAHYFVKQMSANDIIALDTFVFANIDGVNGETHVDLEASMPTAAQIVHTQTVTQAGLINDKTAVYSVVLDTTVGDFVFNWIGLINRETGTLCVVMHTDATKKTKTTGTKNGNTITESLWVELDNAAENTGINVSAETWMVNYHERFLSEEERIRLSNLDLYSRFYIADELILSYHEKVATISKGTFYCAGLRCEVVEEQKFTATENDDIYAIAWLDGTITGSWQTHFKLVATKDRLKDYEENGTRYFAEKIAMISDDGELVIQKPNKNGLIHSLKLANELGQSTELAISQKAATDGISTAIHTANEAKKIAETDASESTAGRVKIINSVNSESKTEAATLSAVKQAYDKGQEALNKANSIELKGSGLGVSQTWQNVASERVIGVEYVNTTGKPIMIHIMLQHSSAASWADMIIKIDDCDIKSGDGGHDNKGSLKTPVISAIVPSGSKYKVTSSSSSSIFNWTELR